MRNASPGGRWLSHLSHDAHHAMRTVHAVWWAWAVRWTRSAARRTARAGTAPWVWCCSVRRSCAWPRAACRWRCGHRRTGSCCVCWVSGGWVGEWWVGGWVVGWVGGWGWGGRVVGWGGVKAVVGADAATGRAPRPLGELPGHLDTHLADTARRLAHGWQNVPCYVPPTIDPRIRYTDASMPSDAYAF